jgi:hypothetical protein
MAVSTSMPPTVERLMSIRPDASIDSGVTPARTAQRDVDVHGAVDRARDAGVAGDRGWVEAAELPVGDDARVAVARLVVNWNCGVVAGRSRNRRASRRVERQADSVRRRCPSRRSRRDLALVLRSIERGDVEP